MAGCTPLAPMAIATTAQVTGTSHGSRRRYAGDTESQQGERGDGHVVVVLDAMPDAGGHCVEHDWVDTHPRTRGAIAAPRRVATAVEQSGRPAGPVLGVRTTLASCPGRRRDDPARRGASGIGEWSVIEPSWKTCRTRTSSNSTRASASNRRWHRHHSVRTHHRHRFAPRPLDQLVEPRRELVGGHVIGVGAERLGAGRVRRVGHRTPPPTRRATSQA